jgi:hypothetical protein
MTLTRLLVLGAVALFPAAPHARSAAPGELPAAAMVAGRAPADTAFAALIRRLSEPGGFFDTDNLISNESSYLHALGPLRKREVQGGAYIGVGPDQNFSYIAQIRPAIAFIIDIRRDNLLEHLLFKAIFVQAPDRATYLGLLLGRPAQRQQSGGTDVERLLARFDGPADPRTADNAVASVLRTVKTFGLDLSAADLRTIERFHRAFIEGGLELQFTSFNRAPRPDYPTLGRLFLEKDGAGERRSYMATEELYRTVRDLQVRDMIVPVVGDLAGSHALAAIGEEIARRRLKVSAFYTSNVEFYLMRAGSFPAFAATTSRLPIDDRSVIVRSYFGRFQAHPNAVDGYNSVQVVEPLTEFVREMRAGGYRSYEEIVRKNVLPNL